VISATNGVFAKPAYSGDRLMYVPEISEATGRGHQAVYKWMRQGKLPYARVGGRRAAWASDVLAMLQPVEPA